MLQPSEAAVSAFICHLHAGSKPDLLRNMLESSSMRESYSAALAVAYTHDFPVGSEPPAIPKEITAAFKVQALQPVISLAAQIAGLAVALRNADLQAYAVGRREDELPPIEHYMQFATEVLTGAYERAGSQFPILLERIKTA